MIIAVFRSRVAKEHGGEFERRYAEMSALVEAIPGYRSHESFSSANGENVLIVEFLTREAFDAWDKHPEHKKAKMLGKDYIFDSFDVKVGEVFERHTKPEVRV